MHILQVSVSQPPSSSSRPPSLLSVDIRLDVIDEIEERKDRERIAWRRRSRMARDLAIEREVASGEGSEDYPVVRATVGQGAVGDGRQSGLGWRGRKEVCSSNV